MFEREFPERRFYQQDREYAAKFIDPSFIDQFLGQGMRTRVYALDPQFDSTKIYATILDPRVGVLGSQRELELSKNKFVIKIPKIESYVPPSKAPKKLFDFQKTIELLGDAVMLPTFILSSAGTSEYCIVQKHLGQFENISPSNISEVYPQLEEIVSAYNILRREGLYLELLGRDGTLSCLRALVDPRIQPEMTNVVIQRTNEGPRAKIHDVSLLRFTPRESSTALACAKNLLKFTAICLNRKLMLHHFGLKSD